MKEFFLKHPYSTGFIVFLLIMIGGVSLGVIAGNTIINPDLRNPTDFGHHGKMGAGIIITLALGASLLFGILSGLITTYFLLEKAKVNKMP
jgi:hypothetical protein